MATKLIFLSIAKCLSAFVLLFLMLLMLLLLLPLRHTANNERTNE